MEDIFSAMDGSDLVIFIDLEGMSHPMHTQPGEDLVRDPDTYDDGEFYRQLLKEFLEGAGPGSNAVGVPMGVGTKKQRARRERGASKGRKLRYDVQVSMSPF